MERKNNECFSDIGNLVSRDECCFFEISNLEFNKELSKLILREDLWCKLKSDKLEISFWLRLLHLITFKENIDWKKTVSKSLFIKKNIKQTFLLIAFVFTILVSCTNIGKQQNMENVSQSDKEAICRTLELYMEGSRQGDSNITAKAFANEATLSGIYEGRFMVVPIQVLYDLVDQGAKDAKYTLTTCSVENNIAIVRIEAQFGAKQYTDMFTLVKDGNDWKIISKVYHLH